MARQHSIISASAFERWVNCPASPRLAMGMPDKSSEAAMEGTAAHWLAETCLKERKNANEYLGSTIPVDNHETGFLVTQEMADGVNLYCSTIWADLQALDPSVCTMGVEVGFHLDWINNQIFGTNDCFIGQNFGKLIVYDFKYGAGVAVDADENGQMMIYALGALKGRPYEEIELVIIQPRAQHEKGPIRRWSITVEDLTLWSENVLAPAAALALSPDAPPHAGEWCRWCRAYAICPEVRAEATKAAMVAFSNASEPEPLSFPAPDMLTPEQIGRVLTFTHLFSTWASEVEQYAKAEMERGRSISGWKLVRGRKTRKWADEAEVVRALEPRFGVEIYEEPKLRSPAQMEKALKGVELDSLIEITQGVSVAPASDKRDAVVPAIEAFKNA